MKLTPVGTVRPNTETTQLIPSQRKDSNDRNGCFLKSIAWLTDANNTTLRVGIAFFPMVCISGLLIHGMITGRIPDITQMLVPVASSVGQLATYTIRRINELERKIEEKDKLLDLYGLKV